MQSLCQHFAWSSQQFGQADVMSPDPLRLRDFRSWDGEAGMCTHSLLSLSAELIPPERVPCPTVRDGLRPTPTYSMQLS